MLLATFGKSLSVKLGADCRRERSITMRLPCIAVSRVFQGTAVILLPTPSVPPNATIAWVAWPLLSRITSRTVPRLSPEDDSTVAPISFDARCCVSAVLDVLAVRLELLTEPDEEPDELYMSLPPLLLVDGVLPLDDDVLPDDG